MEREDKLRSQMNKDMSKSKLNKDKDKKPAGGGLSRMGSRVGGSQFGGSSRQSLRNSGESSHYNFKGNQSNAGDDDDNQSMYSHKSKQSKISKRSKTSKVSRQSSKISEHSGGSQSHHSQSQHSQPKKLPKSLTRGATKVKKNKLKALPSGLS